jgi:hypothetical protein
MNPRLFRQTAFIVILFLPGFILFAQDITSLKAVHTSEAFTIDCKFNEAVWNDAPVFSGFRMVEPTPGTEPSEKTEVRIALNNSGLCFAIKCFDSEPRKISANTMEHDKAEERNEDQLSIMLDPFQNKRSGYLFISNPKGARSEGFATGEHFSLGWDGLWQVKTSIGSDGWSAEIFIPFKTISFNPDLNSWGLNIERYIARKQEVIRYSGISLNSFFSNPKEAGLLEGMTDIRQGLGLTVRPYGITSRADNRLDNLKPDNSLKGGFDVYKNITPNLVGAVTVNTDFAETEVDERRLNLTRFPLFYPEKRTFFLEGSDIFDFGGVSSHTIAPFFSRRIGLYDGNSIPLNWGGKIFGKIGNTNIAALNVKSGRSGMLDPQNMFAARISQNILDESRVGMIMTNGSPSGEKNSLAGVDFEYKTSRFLHDKNFSIDLWGINSWNESKGGNKKAYGLRFDYPNDLIDASASYYYVGDSINPGLGFLPRNAYHNLNTNISFMPRPEKGLIGRLVRQWFFELRVSNYWNLNGQLESRQVFTAPVNIRTESGEHIEFNIIPNKEVLPGDFEVSEGVILTKGPYSFTNYSFEFNSATYRRVQLDFSDRFGSFYSGNFNDIETALTFKIDGYANIQLGGNFIKGDLPQGSFNENVLFSKFNFYLNPDLGISNYIQFDDVSNQIGYNGRFFWQIRPGNIIYLVYNNNTERIFNPERRLRMNADQIMFKVQMTMRF